MEHYRLNPNVELQKVANDKTIAFVKNHNKFYELGLKETVVLKYINGFNSPEKIAQLCGYYSVEEIVELEAAFEKIGIISKKSFNNQKHIHILKLKISIFSPDKIFQNRFISELLYYCMLFSCYILGGAAVLQSLYFFFYGTSVEKIVYINSFQVENSDIVLIYVIIVISSILHEIGHMITAKHYNIKVPDMGVMLYCFIPCAYTDLTFLTYCNCKRIKIHSLFAGCLVNMGIIGMSMSFFNFFPICKVTRYCLFLVIYNIGCVFCNLIIFFKFDGYYIFETLLGEQNLRNNSVKSIILMLKRKKLLFHKKDTSIITRTISNDSGIDNIVYVIYAVLSVIYIPLVIMGGILPEIFKLFGG